MVVVAVGMGSLRVDILPQSRVEHGAFQVVGGQRVPGHETVYISVLHHGLHGSSGVSVERKGRSHNPENVSVFSFVFEQLKKTVVISGIRSLPASALPENELVAVCLLR